MKLEARKTLKLEAYIPLKELSNFFDEWLEIDLYDFHRWFLQYQKTHYDEPNIIRLYIDENNRCFYSINGQHSYSKRAVDPPSQEILKKYNFQEIKNHLSQD